jgi:hypothetical protein
LFNLFYGEAFPAFGRDALDLELGWRPPGGPEGDGIGWGNLKVIVFATYYYDGITGQDFGASPGTFEVEADLVWGVGASFEFF